MTTNDIVNRYNLNLANGFINDNVPTRALEIDPQDDVFNLNLSGLCAILK